MSNVPAVVSNLIGNLVAAQAVTPVDSGGDFLYLKMNKQGEWVYGAEETEVGKDSFFVVDPNSYAQGFVAWDSDSGTLIDESMAVAGQPPVIISDLPALPAGIKWQAQVAFAMKGVEGAEDGLQLLFKVSSRGGKAAVSTLLGQIVSRGKAGNADLCPIVALESSSYKHKKYGKIFTPDLSVDEWIDLPDGAPAAEPAAEPVAAIVEPEPVVEPEPAAKPARKRRERKTA